MGENIIKSIIPVPSKNNLGNDNNITNNGNESSVSENGIPLERLFLPTKIGSRVWPLGTIIWLRKKGPLKKFLEIFWLGFQFPRKLEA